VIRPHPQTISGDYARSKDELEALKRLVGPRVVLDIPPVLSEKLAWDLPKNDMHHLGELLFHSAMCLNASSTLCLDACVVDRPVIATLFDGWEELPYEKSARQAFDYIHFAKLLALGGVKVARSFPDLEEHINTYLRCPDLDQEKRSLSARMECGPRDGLAAERIASVLLRLACN
jgi:hypothetical protein